MKKRILSAWRVVWFAHALDHCLQNRAKREHAGLGDIEVRAGLVLDDRQRQQMSEFHEGARPLKAETVAGELGQGLV